MTDFGADDAFAAAGAKLKEHYGIEVPVSAMRWFTEEHGAAMRAQEKQKSDWSDRAGVPVLITEMDGSMLPVVEVAEPVAGEARLDRRKTRQVSWKEAPPEWFLFASSSFPGSCVLLSGSFRAKPATVRPTGYATNRYTPVDNAYGTASFSSELHLYGKTHFCSRN